MSSAPALPPSDGALESTAAFLAEGYEFIRTRCRRLGSEVFRTRLMLQETLCFSGVEAAKVFYDTEKFQRTGAAPGRLKKSLFGTDGVQTLDGESHAERKQLFMGIMTGGGFEPLLALVRGEWRDAVPRWQTAGTICFYDEMVLTLASAVCQWAGVPVHPDELPERADWLEGMFDGAGAVGPRHMRARRSRRRAEKWIEDLVEAARAGTVRVRPGSPLAAIAFHRTKDGTLLPRHTAAVEVLNLLRPTVAVAVYLCFIIHAFHGNAARRDRCAGDAGYRTWFVQEVRRFYPFFPVAAAKTRCEFEWHGHRIPAGRRAMLDLFGTSRDPAAWQNPDSFEPLRFEGREPGAFDLIPQGGGDHFAGHRCAGEWLTIGIMEQAAEFFSAEAAYSHPPQDLAIPFNRFPGLPRSRVLLSDVRPLAG